MGAWLSPCDVCLRNIFKREAKDLGGPYIEHWRRWAGFARSLDGEVESGRKCNWRWWKWARSRGIMRRDTTVLVNCRRSVMQCFCRIRWGLICCGPDVKSSKCQIDTWKSSDMKGKNSSETCLSNMSPARLDKKKKYARHR